MTETPTANDRAAEQDNQPAAQGNIDAKASYLVTHVADLHTYQVSKEWLEGIKRSTSSGNHELAWGLFLLGVAFASFFALGTTEPNNFTVHIFLVLFGIVGVVLGLYMVLKWWSVHNEPTRLIDDVLNLPEKSRKPIK